MSMVHRIENDVCILTFDPTFTANDIDHIRRYVESVIQNESILKIIFNFRNVARVDSLGIGTILELRKILHNHDVQLHFCEVNEYICDIFDVTNIDTLVAIHPTEEEALSQLNSML